jgi:hypothetical protein
VIYGDAHVHHSIGSFIQDVDDALTRRASFVVGTMHDLKPEERAYVAKIGNPSVPLFATVDRLPPGSLPGSLQLRPEERSGKPSDYIEGLLYLGPEPDRNLTGGLPLSAGEEKELARRGTIMSDPQNTMRARYQGRPLVQKSSERFRAASLTRGTLEE